MYFKNILQKIVTRFKSTPSISTKNVITDLDRDDPVIKKVYVKQDNEYIVGEYRISPYSKDFTPPKSTKYDYESIETTCIAENDLTEFEDTFYESNDKSDHTETISNFKIEKIIPEPTAFQDTYETESADNSELVDNFKVHETEDTFFVMNGYGILAKLDSGDEIETYLDTGDDYDLQVDQKVKLFAENDKYLDKIATIIKPLNKERKGDSSEILIQSVYDIKTDV